MTQWEYHTILRTREIKRFSMRDVFDVSVTDWNISGDEILASLKRLGSEGWELVAVSTRASLLNSPMASEEMWIFKRQIS